MIRVVETNERVGDGKPDLVTRFRRRAERFAQKRNAERIFPSYRYEVVREAPLVVYAMQNGGGRVNRIELALTWES
jgi:hypothetical protein